MTQTHDTLLRFLLPTAGVRGVAVHLDDTWRTIASRVAYPPAVAELLGEAAAAAALFTGVPGMTGHVVSSVTGSRRFVVPGLMTVVSRSCVEPLQQQLDVRFLLSDMSSP